MDLEKVYADSISNAQCAFAYHEGVFDDAGEMVDYIFLDVNKAFEDITGLKKENIVGKRFVRVFFASLKSPLLQNKFPRHRVGNFTPRIS